jgi:dephospho-CoA kinase
MLKVGLTGGIGSGKTLICSIFETFGVPVFYADLEAGILMEKDLSIHRNLTGYFGEDIYRGGSLDREKLASVVFHDKNALTYLNSVVHPAVGKKFDHWAEKHADQKYIIEEAAILFESGASDRFDLIITVSAPDELRIRRVMERDQVTREDVTRRMNNQLSEEERNQLADVVIINDGMNLVIPQVLQVHNRIMEKRG